MVLAARYCGVDGSIVPRLSQGLQGIEEVGQVRLLGGVKFIWKRAL